MAGLTEETMEAEAVSDLAEVVACLHPRRSSAYWPSFLKNEEEAEVERRWGSWRQFHETSLLALYVMNLSRKAEGVRYFVRGRTKVGAEVVRKVAVAVEAASSLYLKMSNPRYGRWEHG